VAPTTCPSGKSTHTRKHLKFKEVQLANDEYKIRGRCDGILVIDDEEHIMDIKSIASRTQATSAAFCFEDLEENGPKPDHIIQLQLYMWILGIPRGHLLYVAKNDHKIASFAIPYDPGSLSPYLSRIKRLISIADDLQAGKKPDLPEPCAREACLCHEIVR
jgi:hypothetical protein